MLRDDKVLVLVQEVGGLIGHITCEQQGGMSAAKLPLGRPPPQFHQDLHPLNVEN